MQPQQIHTFHLGITHDARFQEPRPTLEFVSRKLEAIVRGEQPDDSEPPPLELSFQHITNVRECHTGTVVDLADTMAGFKGTVGDDAVDGPLHTLQPANVQHASRCSLPSIYTTR